MFRSRNMRSRVQSNPRLFTEKQRYKDRPMMDIKFADIPQEKVEKKEVSDYDFSPTKSEAPSPAKDLVNEDLRIESPKLPQILEEESPMTPTKQQTAELDLAPEQIVTPTKQPKPQDLLKAVEELPEELADTKRKDKQSSCDEADK